MKFIHINFHDTIFKDFEDTGVQSQKLILQTFSEENNDLSSTTFFQRIKVWLR